MVNTHFIREWIKALRSGNYKQAKSTLGRHPENGQPSYCCLGVACEVAIGMGMTRDRELHGDTVYYDGESLIPWHGFRRQIGLDDWTVNVPIGAFDEDHEYEDRSFGDARDVELASLNDDYGWTFDQIADALEHTYIDGRVD